MILGESGSGKSTSMRNLDPEKVGVFNVAGKPLPFRKHLKTVNNATYSSIYKVLQAPKLKTYIIDDAQYLMAFEELDRAKETGYTKFTEMALNFSGLVRFVINKLPPDVIVYFLQHTETTDQGKIKAKTSGKMIDSKLTLAVPDHYEYTYDDFLSEAPYEKLYSYFGNEFAMNREVLKMANNANAVKFRGFRTQWKLYLEAKDRERKQQTAIVPNQTEFDGQMIELECGNWESSDFGICRVNKFGAREMACSHPIMPVGRLVNIDTGEVKLRIAYKRPGRDKKWQTTIISKEAVADSKQLNKHMSAIGVSINQKSAPILMEYLTDIEDRNYDLIPESKSIGRLGYIEGEGFSPYVENLVFDGDAAYRSLYGYIKSGGSQTAWFETALECRKMSTTARIFLAASFALPF